MPAMEEGKSADGAQEVVNSEENEQSNPISIIRRIRFRDLHKRY